MSEKGLGEARRSSEILKILIFKFFSESSFFVIFECFGVCISLLGLEQEAYQMLQDNVFEFSFERLSEKLAL